MVLSEQYDEYNMIFPFVSMSDGMQKSILLSYLFCLMASVMFSFKKIVTNKDICFEKERNQKKIFALKKETKKRYLLWEKKISKKIFAVEKETKETYLLWKKRYRKRYLLQK